MWKEEDDWVHEEFEREIDVQDEGVEPIFEGTFHGKKKEEPASFHLDFDTNHVEDSSKAKSDFSTRAQDIFQRLGSPQVQTDNSEKKEDTVYQSLQEKDWIFQQYLAKPPLTTRTPSTEGIPAHLKDPTKFTHYVLEDKEISDAQNAAIALSFLQSITEGKNPEGKPSEKPAKPKFTAEGSLLMEEAVLGPKKATRKAQDSTKQREKSSKHAKIALAHLDSDEEKLEDKEMTESKGEASVSKKPHASRKFKASKNT